MSRQNKSSLIRIHRIAKGYGKRPSELLFPQLKNPNITLFVDNFVFEAGYIEDTKEQVDLETEKVKYFNKLFEAFVNIIIKLLGGRR